MDKNNARKRISLDENKKYALFTSDFKNPIKNYNLALDAISIAKSDITLIELKNYSRKEVNILLNASDLLLVTSLSETGPMIVKEAMACNCPIVSTDVGDVKEIIANTEGCYITSYQRKDIAEKINLALSFRNSTSGRDKITHLDVNIIAEKIKSVYNKVLLDK